MTRIGTFQAKAQLSKLLERAEAGEIISITRHGKEVARLVPPPGRNAGPKDVHALIDRWKHTRKSVKLGGLTIRDLINQGRR